jgi:hypothetical protein
MVCLYYTLSTGNAQEGDYPNLDCDLKLKSGLFAAEKWTPSGVFRIGWYGKLLPSRREETKSQIHKRFTDEQVRVLFQGYCQGQLVRTDLQDLLDIGKSRFFALLKAYREDPEGFTTV